ncbi:hypothetical protein FRB99_003427 [Tulasnella sp. 403]|nr:hypothetical protein FRB99_003427 [Tulasnella sp. 403]
MSSVIIKGLRVPNVKKPFGTSHLDANHIPRSGLPQVETKMPQPSSAEIAHILDELNMSPQEFMQAAAEPDGMERLLARVTKPDIIPTLDDSKEAMDQMLAQIQQAKTIALREKSLSPFRYSPPPRAEFSFALEAKRQECEHQQALERPQMVQTHIGTRPHVSRLPLDELSRVNLRNMDVRKVHTGQYLLCRIVSLPVRVFAVQFGVEDPRGSVTLVSLYGYPGTLGASMRTLDALFPLGYVLAIKEPYMKEMASGGGAHIRVDCASDLLFIHTDHPSLEGVQWKTRSPASPLAVITSPDAWKELGNQYFKDALYFPAAVTYSRGLQHHPTAHLLRLNRAMAYLRLGYFGAALADCQQIMDLPTSTGNVHLKALFRAAQAKYGLGWWNDALSTFKDVARLYPSEAKVCNGWIEKCIQRKREAESGQYRWVTMFEEAQIPGKRLDVAEYVGAIEVTSSPPCGGGRGVIATRDIEPGELLVVSKAFAVCYPEDLPKDTKYLAINFLNDRVQKDCSAVLDHKIIEQLVSDPGRSSALYDLYAGPEEASPPPTYSIPDRTAVPIEHLPHSGVNVDASRIQGITTYNAFKPTTLKRRAVALVQRNSKEKDDGPSALFLLPSLFNHSCAPNARWYCFGDIMVIRALRAIQKGEEVYLAYGGQGLTYLTRNQDIGLTKFLGTCQCNLCSADREDGLVHCKQRESIFGNIYSCDTIDGVKKGIKALKKTYKRNPNGEGMWAATNHLAELHMNNGDTAGYIRETIQAMGYAGITVRDKSIRGSQRVTDGLPIGLCENAAEPNAFSRVCEVIVDACMALSDTFYEEFSDTARGKSWEDAAAWLHDICFGGGSELFKARYPVSVRDAPTPTNTSRPGLARHVKILEMSAGSLSGLMSKAASKDNVDISSGSLPEDISFELPPESPTKRPAIVSSSPRVPSSNSRNVFSRLPSESMNVPSTMDNSTATGSKLPSFLVDPDETNLSMLDTPIREKRTFDDITAGGRRGRSSLGGAPRGQMTLREQEKASAAH